MSAEAFETSHAMHRCSPLLIATLSVAFAYSAGGLVQAQANPSAAVPATKNVGIPKTKYASPTATEQSETRKLIEELYSQDIAAARQPAEHAALARRLWMKGAESLPDAKAAYGL